MTCTLSRSSLDCDDLVRTLAHRLQVSLLMPTCALHMAYLSKPHLCDPGYVQLSQSRPHNLVDTDPCAGTGPFPKPRALVLPLVHFGQSKPEGHGGIVTADSDLMHHQFRYSLLQWNPGPASRNPTNIVSAACGKSHAVILQEDSDHVPHISEQFLVCPHFGSMCFTAATAGS